MTRYTLGWMILLGALTLPKLAWGQPATEQDGIWVDADGMTLYTFDKDTRNKSVCTGECAKNWPPLLVKPGEEAAQGRWTQVRRDDGAMQWAYDGKPLYTFIKDKITTDKTGDGMRGIWHVAKP
ncbi:COG4315 family predicted lipoprotein [Pseudomonas sp. Marseille-QA0332]